MALPSICTRVHWLVLARTQIFASSVHEKMFGQNWNLFASFVSENDAIPSFQLIL